MFVCTVLVATALSTLFATIWSSAGVPQDRESFLYTTLMISTCVVVPLAAFAAQNDYRLSKYRAQLEQFASTDPLTGIWNRRYFQHRLTEEAERMSRTRTASAVALFDIDDFKAVNDGFGHKAGDAVLKAISQAVSSELRGPMDRVARWGGEEFVLLLTDLSREDAIMVCERVRLRIADTVIYHGSKKIKCSASFGVAPMLAHDVPQDIVERADIALYQAKRSGKNRVVAAPDRQEPKLPDNVTPMGRSARQA